MGLKENPKKPPNFPLDDGSWALFRCFEYGRENYALSVVDGVCSFCGFDINKCSEEEWDE